MEKLLNDIESSKLLLENSEINKLIDEYNIKLNEFNNNVEKFNFHYQEQIIFIRNKILKQIIVLAEKYAKNNNIDLVLDSNHYLIASNEINITNFIKKELNEIKLNLERKILSKINFQEIKNILFKTQLQLSKIDDSTYFSGVNSISNSSKDDITFFKY